VTCGTYIASGGRPHVCPFLAPFSPTSPSTSARQTRASLPAPRSSSRSVDRRHQQRSRPHRGVGTEGEGDLRRTARKVTAIKPIRTGVIADFGRAERLLTYVIKKAQSAAACCGPRAVVMAVPTEITPRSSAARCATARWRQRERGAHDEEGDGGRDRRGDCRSPRRREQTCRGCRRPRHTEHRRHSARRVVSEVGAGGGNELDEAIILHARKAHNS